MNSDRGDARADRSPRLVWLIVLIGLLTAVCTLVSVRHITSAIREQRASVNCVRDSIEQLSASVNREFATLADSMTRHLHDEVGGDGIDDDIDVAAAALLNVTSQLDRFETSDRNAPMRPATARMRELFARLFRLHGECARLNERSRVANAAIAEQRKRIDASVVAMRAALTTFEGKRRLELASRIRAYRKSRGDDATDLAGGIIAEIGSKNALAEFPEEVAKLELLTARLLGEDQPDRLNDLKDNQFSASVSHASQMLARQATLQSGENAELRAAFEEFRRWVFGRRYQIDAAHQTIYAGIDGLFPSCKSRLELNADREALRTAIARRSDEYHSACEQMTTLAAGLKDELAAGAERTLAFGWRSLLVLTTACAALLALLGRRVAATIRRQFAAISDAAGQLRRGNAQMAAIHQASLDCVMVLDADLRVVEFNPAAERTFECAKAAALGRRLDSFVKLGPSGSPAGLEKLLGSAFDVTAARFDGREFPAEVAITTTHQTGGPALYVASLRDITQRRRAEAEKEELTQRLVDVSREAGMAEVATGVLHNVGNALNSVNVSAGVVGDALRQSETATLAKVATMLRERRSDLGTFLTQDERGRLVPDFLVDLADCLLAEHRHLVEEASTLSKGVEHVKEIIAAQQSLARRSTVTSAVDPIKVVESAITMQGHAFKRDGIELERRFDAAAAVGMLDHHKVLQILMNLINNARQATCDRAGGPRIITLSVELMAEGAAPPTVRFSVTDTGSGVAPQHLSRLFTHGFTTKSDGHGFGLHSAANAAREMGGSLSASSDGPNRGATFTLELPFPAPAQEGKICQAA